MKKLIDKILHGERGSLPVVMAIAMTALLSFAALVVDLGAAYVDTAVVQTAADAAVMAAGLSLPVRTDDRAKQADMRGIVEDYLEKNGVSMSADVNIYFAEESGGKYYRIGVDVPAETETTFAKVMGVDELTFTRSAESRAIPCISLADVVPLSVQEAALTSLIEAGNTEHVVLKYGKKTGDVVQGAFGAIDLDGVQGGGANDYCTWLANGYSGQLGIGTELPVESGNMAGPTLAGVSARYNACTHYAAEGGCTKDHYVPGCPRVMKVPVVVSLSSKQVEIVGFAAFVLEDYTTYSSQGYVVGTYVDMVNVGSVSGDLTGTAEDFGVYSLTLSK